MHKAYSAYCPRPIQLIIFRASFEHASLTYLPFISSKYWHHSNIVSSHIYHSFPSRILASFECSSVIYLQFISLKSTDIIRIWFRPIFTINFPQKFLNHFDMILSLVYDLFPSKILASFEYGFDTYLPFASHKNAGIIWIWSCYIFAIYLLQKYWNHLDMFLLHIYH